MELACTAAASAEAVSAASSTSSPRCQGVWATHHGYCLKPALGRGWLGAASKWETEAELAELLERSKKSALVSLDGEKHFEPHRCQNCAPDRDYAAVAAVRWKSTLESMLPCEIYRQKKWALSPHSLVWVWSSVRFARRGSGWISQKKMATYITPSKGIINRLQSILKATRTH